jgi:nucleoside-diphosphate-sugar epimerase
MKDTNMWQSVRNFKPWQALPRMLADFINVHLCMMGALATPLFYLALQHQNDRATTRLAEAMAYYSSSFVLLSPLFPLVFLLNGFYTNSRGYIGRYKKLVILRGVSVSMLLFLAANFIFFRRTLVPRSVLLVFCGLAMLSLALSRLVKGALSDRFEIRPKNGKGDSPSERLVLVLGGAGYIGSILVRKLLETGRKVRVLDSLVYGDGALRDILRHPDLELKVGDCRKIQDVVGAVKGAESIVHLAAIVGDPACEVDRQTSLQINYAATRMLIEVARGNGINRLVFASSCSVYGASDLLMDENSTVKAVSLYGQTKIDSEEALLDAHSDSFYPVILRLATVFGLSYRPRFDLVVNLLTAKACAEGAITVFNGTQWRPFIHVRDVALGIVQVLEAPLSLIRGEIFNLGDTRMNHQLSEVAERILTVFPNTKVEHTENSDRRNYRVSFDKIRHQLGFECSLGLDDGIQELRRAFEEKQVLDYRDALYYNQEFLKLLGSQSCKNELDEHVMAAFAQAPTSNRNPARLMAQAAGTER